MGPKPQQRNLCQDFNLRGPHYLMIDFIDPQSNVLDAGSGRGDLTRFLTKVKECSVTSVEIDPILAQEAVPYARRVIVGDIIQALSNDLAGEKYDYIVFADVIEHLSAPWEVLELVKGALREGGCILCSVPNIANYRIRKDLLLGRFDYQPCGILDRTHLRFFTAKTIRELFGDSGYRIDAFIRVYTGRKNGILGYLAPNAFTYQFVIKASVER
ncbi:MAG: class I SAM-dependent methyltransferase [Armatimonadetes bacterium]|nr:class I SAM-dependent methyltransferase [Armatimonadota bacterium]